MCTGIQGEITSIKVRDAIVDCFTAAHRDDASMQFRDRYEAELYCRELIRKFFLDVGEDFDHPSKTSLIKILDKLADFAQNFRDKSVIEKNYAKIIDLVNRL